MIIFLMIQYKKYNYVGTVENMGGGECGCCKVPNR